MTVSFANVDPASMELTPCRFKYKGVDLGGTLGNVKVSLNFKKADMKSDQFGDTILDRRVSGVEYKIETTLSQVNNTDTWKAAFPNLLRVGTGPYSMVGISKVGESDLALSGILELHPLALSDADKSGDFTFWKATAESVSEVTFGPTEQQGLKVVFHVYPDMSASPARFFVRGDSTIGLVSAFADAPVFVGTGNGLMTAVAVYSGQTSTETITVKCLGIPSTGKSNWAVTGSLSGALGYLEVVTGSATFTSSKVAFTISDGSTDFIIGDQFTLSVHAANYV